MLIGILVALALAGPPLAAFLGRSVGEERRRTDLDRRVGLVALAAAIGALAAVVLDGDERLLGGALTADRVGAVWLTFVLAIGLAVRTFAARQLAADGAREAFRVRSALVVASAGLLAIATAPWALALAAIAGSLTTAWLVRSRPGTAGGALHVGRTLLLGDAVLVLGLAALTIGAVRGSADLAAGTVLGDASAFAASEGIWLHLGAVAIVVAALIRCAQPPAHRWLPRTLAAPTPVSALLHAGMVNAGGILLVRSGAAVSRSELAVLVGLAGATAGIVLGLSIMRTRRDVKGTLVWSTTAQMGLMLVQALVGLGAAAAAHLVAHGAYKSNLFLRSGEVLDHPHLSEPTITWRTRALAALVGLGITGASVLALDLDLGAHDGAAVLLPVLAWLTVTTVLAGPAGLARGRTAGTVRLVVTLAVLTPLYLGGVTWFEKWLALPDATPPAAGVLTAVVIGAVLATVATPWLTRADATGTTAWLRARLDAASRRPLLDQFALGGRS
jgi:NADH:ubiquinone oxidoreductase subunit 5 (subunit L)/multisubunit Na+/H+ antiporter MnhA subunit